MRPGGPSGARPDYLRHGTTKLFAALDVKAGAVIGALPQRHRAREFRKFVRTVDDSVPRELDPT